MEKLIAFIVKRWELLSTFAAVCITLGVIQANYASMSHDVSDLKQLNQTVPVLQSKVNNLDMIPAKLTDIQVQLATQGEDIKIIRHQIESQPVASANRNRP